MDTNALFKINYGLYIISANDENKDNGCIVNTVSQVTSDPCQIEVAINKLNYTTKMIEKTKKFNISILSENAKFEIFQRFGYQSGRDIDKFDKFPYTKRAQNGILYITRDTNAYFCATVKQEVDLGTHILFIAQIDEAEVLSDSATCSYNFYQNNIKPKQQIKTKGWRCKICNYILEEDILPDDFICPICKHGALDFEKIL